MRCAVPSSSLGSDAARYRLYETSSLPLPRAIGALAERLANCRVRLAHVKCPRSVEVPGSRSKSCDNGARRAACEAVRFLDVGVALVDAGAPASSRPGIQESIQESRVVRAGHDRHRDDGDQVGRRVTRLREDLQAGGRGFDPRSAHSRCTRSLNAQLASVRISTRAQVDRLAPVTHHRHLADELCRGELRRCRPRAARVGGAAPSAMARPSCKYGIMMA